MADCIPAYFMAPRLCQFWQIVSVYAKLAESLSTPIGFTKSQEQRIITQGGRRSGDGIDFGESWSSSVHDFCCMLMTDDRRHQRLLPKVVDYLSLLHWRERWSWHGWHC